MRRSTWTQLLLTTLVACGVSSQAARVSWTVPVTPDRVFSTASLVVTEFGYVIEDADREAGFIRASRPKSSAVESALTGIDEVWELAVSIHRSEGTTTVTLQPAYIQHRPYGRRYSGGITDGHQAHVDSIRTAILARLAP